MNDGFCEYVDGDGIKCEADSEVADKNGKNYCMDHYRYVRDGEKAQNKPKRKRYTK